MSEFHHETHFEAYVVEKLVEQGWLLGKSDGYDKDYALYPEDLVAWLKESQPAKWDKLVALNGDNATKVLMNRLEQALEKHGMVQVLRRGFDIAGCGHIDVSEAAPEDKRNEAIQRRYASNRLRVLPQLKYHPAHEYAIDLGLFLNGLPVATVELKTDFTQSIDAAKEQYRTDRLPIDPRTKRKEPLLTFKRGAVVHFAMSDSEIWMTTKLAGENTFFLPFNKGKDGRAGNPARDDGDVLQARRGGRLHEVAGPGEDHAVRRRVPVRQGHPRRRRAEPRIRRRPVPGRLGLRRHGEREAPLRRGLHADGGGRQTLTPDR